MQIVAPGVTDTGVRVLHLPFGLVPVFAEFDCTAHAPLVTGQALLVLFEAVKRGNERAVRQRGKASEPQVDTNGRAGGRHRPLYFTLCLNAHVPLASAQADRGILEGAQHLTAQTQSHPAQLGQENAAIASVQFELLGVWVAKALAAALAFETREIGAFGEEVFVCPLQVFEGVLQRVTRSLFEPWCLKPIAPVGQTLCHGHIADELLARLRVGFL